LELLIWSKKATNTTKSNKNRKKKKKEQRKKRKKRGRGEEKSPSLLPYKVSKEVEYLYPREKLEPLSLEKEICCVPYVIIFYLIHVLIMSNASFQTNFSLILHWLT